MPALSAAAPLRPEARARREPHRPAAVGARERARRSVVRLVLLLLLLAIAEGALRKWVAPQLGAYIFFLRDPVLLLAYYLATRHRLWPRRELLLQIGVWMALFGVVLFALQAGSGGHSDHRLVLGIYGWRAYFLYLPLAFLVGAVFTREDVLRLARLSLWLAVPIALLVAAQFASPPGAAINVGIAEEQELQFKGLGINADRTRPMGPFASGAGQQQFVASAFALLLAFFVSPKRLPQPGLLTLVVTGGAVLSCVALSGSRGLVLQCALAAVVALVVGLIGRGAAVKGRALVWPLVLCVGAVVLYPIVFPEGYGAFADRWTAAARVESGGHQGAGVLLRAVLGLIDFLRVVDAVPLLGTGLGFGGNAAITLGATVDGQRLPYGESDFARQMIDLGPVFGMGYIAYRLALTAALTAMALRAARLMGDPLPLLLWSYVAYVLVMGQLTGQGTINFYGWLFAGLLIAASRPPLPAAQRVAGPPPARLPVLRDAIRVSDSMGFTNVPHTTPVSKGTT